jgi:hypothetical protein
MGITRYPDTSRSKVDTSAGWTLSNLVLAKGQSGYESDTSKLKIGDGTTSWNDLDYVTSPNIIETSFLTMGA